MVVRVAFGGLGRLIALACAVVEAVCAQKDALGRRKRGIRVIGCLSAALRILGFLWQDLRRTCHKNVKNPRVPGIMQPCQHHEDPRAMNASAARGPNRRERSRGPRPRSPRKIARPERPANANARHPENEDGGRPNVVEAAGVEPASETASEGLLRV